MFHCIYIWQKCVLSTLYVWLAHVSLGRNGMHENHVHIHPMSTCVFFKCDQLLDRQHDNTICETHWNIWHGCREREKKKISVTHTHTHFCVFVAVCSLMLLNSRWLPIDKIQPIEKYFKFTTDLGWTEWNLAYIWKKREKEKKNKQRVSLFKFSYNRFFFFVWLLFDSIIYISYLLRFIVTSVADFVIILRDSRINPETGSLPKYFTLISWPTSNPNAAGFAT